MFFLEINLEAPVYRFLKEPHQLSLTSVMGVVFPFKAGESRVAELSSKFTFSGAFVVCGCKIILKLPEAPAAKRKNPRTHL